MNKYEQTFEQYLELIEFGLVKYNDGFGLRDFQYANLGDIEDDRFEYAYQILERMDRYIEDYIVNDIQNCLRDKGYDYCVGDYQDLIDYCKDKLPENKFDIDILDMICNHADEVDLNNCYYDDLTSEEE